MAQASGAVVFDWMRLPSYYTFPPLGVPWTVFLTHAGAGQPALVVDELYFTHTPVDEPPLELVVVDELFFEGP